jgi:integrase/recombinase XerD
MGASVNIMLNPTRKNSDGRRTISLRVTINRKRLYYSLGYHIFETDWNQDKRTVNKNFNPKIYKEVNNTLKHYHIKSLNVIEKIEQSGKPITHELFKRLFFNNTSVSSVLEYYDRIIDDLKTKGKIGNADNYNQSKNALSKFINDKAIKFEDIDVAFLNRWEKELYGTCSGNGISNYLRTLRALFNRAISEDICSQDIYPFKTRFNNKGYDISKLETDTIKRALSEEDIEKLKKYVPDGLETLIEAKNIFFFSFYNMGMNIIDICLLKWTDINDGRIKYIRSKNGKPHNIKIIEPVQNILDYYSDYDFGTDFVFPVLMSQYKTEEQKKSRVKMFTRHINRSLKRFGKLAKISNPDQLTTYVARHTWATTMKRKGVSTTLISEAMKHSDEKTTQIYLDSFENDRVDDMNDMLLN